MTKINTDQKTPYAGAAFSGSEASTSKANALQQRKMTSAKEIDKAASGFESLLVHKMLQEMWSTSSDGIMGENSNQSQIFRDMFNQAVAEEISKGEGIGVKSFVTKELSKNLVPAGEATSMAIQNKGKEKIA